MQLDLFIYVNFLFYYLKLEKYFMQSAPEAFADWYFDQKYWYVIDEKDLPTIPK